MEESRTYLHRIHITIFLGSKKYSFHIVQRTLEVVEGRLSTAEFLAQGAAVFMFLEFLALGIGTGVGV